MHKRLYNLPIKYACFCITICSTSILHAQHITVPLVSAGSTIALPTDDSNSGDFLMTVGISTPCNAAKNQRSIGGNGCQLNTIFKHLFIHDTSKFILHA